MGQLRVVISVLACALFLVTSASLEPVALAADTIRLGFVADATGAGSLDTRVKKPESIYS